MVWFNFFQWYYFVLREHTMFPPKERWSHFIIPYIHVSHFMILCVRSKMMKPGRKVSNCKDLITNYFVWSWTQIKKTLICMYINPEKTIYTIKCKDLWWSANTRSCTREIWKYSQKVKLSTLVSAQTVDFKMLFTMYKSLKNVQYM